MLTNSADVILIVDDEESVRRLLRRILEPAGYACVAARDAAHARELLATEGGFELMLLDVDMPGESGIALARDVLGAHEEIAVVMVSGLDDPVLASTALELGAYGYVLKPFRATELLTDVANALRRRTLELAARRHRAELEATLGERTAALRTRAAQQHVIAEFGQRALYGLDLPLLCEQALHAMREELGAEVALILERLPDRPKMLVIAHSGSAVDMLSATIDVQQRTDVVRALGGEGVTTGPQDFGPDGSLCAAALLGERDLRSGIAVPIPLGQGPFGVIALYRRSGHAYSAEDLSFAAAVANVLGNAIGRRRMEEQMSHQALHDPLTGLPNRSLLADRLERVLARRERTDEHTALLFIDLDNFKRVNDSLGHHVGDQLLVAVARRLSQIARPSDTIARFGGDEFVLLCENLARPGAVVGIAERIAAVLDKPFALDGDATVFITASIGIALTTDTRTTAEALTRDADAAMYRAKEHGRARYQLFDAELRRDVLERMQTETAIRWALERDELRVHYQPVVELGSGRIIGFEALLRWEHPERGLLEASRLIPYVEDSALIVAIGDLALQTACRQLAGWRTDGRPPVWMSVNVAARQLADHGFEERVAAALNATGLGAESLQLEITEATLVVEGAGPAATIARLDALGIALVLDDFGTGYSALSYIQRFPLHALKIDKTFIRDLADDARQRALVGGIVSIAHALGLHTVAEGVETEDQAAIVRELGCEFAQGYLFGRATTAQAAEALLVSQGLLTGQRNGGG